MPSVWPFVPQLGASETYEYYTDVLKSYSQEQRIRLRADPRLILKYTFLLDDEQYAAAKAIASKENQTGSYKLPVWQEAQKVAGSILSSATTINVDTRIYRFIDSEVMVWSDWDNYAVGTISSKTATSITLTAPIGVAFSNAFVVPLKLARTLSGFSTSTGTPNSNMLSATFTCVTNTNYFYPRYDVFDTNDVLDREDFFEHKWPYYEGKHAFVNPPFRVSEQSGSLIRAVELIDNGFGPIAVEATQDRLTERFSMDFFYQGNGQRRETVAFLCRYWGKQKAFWLPTFAKDVSLASGTFSSNSLTVLALGDASSYVDKRLFIKQLDGTYQFATVTTSVVSGPNYVLTLSDTLDAPVSNSVTQSISFMRLSRFDTDVLEITTGAGGSGKVTLNSIEVPN